jgi:hypothetical protein
MRLGDRYVADGRTSERTGHGSSSLGSQMTGLGVALAVVAIVAGCGGDSSPEAFSSEDVVRRAAMVPPTSPDWNWPGTPTSSQPYSEDEGGDPPPTSDPLLVKLYRAAEGLDLIGDAGSRWQDASKLANLSVELWSSAADAHASMPAAREFAHGWAEKSGAVSDEVVDGLGDEAWRILVRENGGQVTYKWRRDTLVLEAHIQCFPAPCPSDIDEAARAWVDAIDDEARRPSG